MEDELNMLFGDPSRYAIEFVLNDNYGGVWLFGECCFWIGGDRIGNWGEGASLREVYFGMAHLWQEDFSDRGDGSLLRLSAGQFFAKMSGLMYGPGSIPEEEQALDEQWGRYYGGVNSEVFDGWHVFLIERDGRTRVVYNRKKGSYAEVGEIYLPAGEVKAVAKQADECLESLYETEREREMGSGPAQ